SLKKAHGRRRHVVRRLVERNDGPARRISAHHAPDHHVIEEHHDPAGESEDDGFVIGNEPCTFLFGCGLGDQTFGPGHYKGKPLMWRKILSAKCWIALLIAPGCVCLPFFAFSAGIASTVCYQIADVWRQKYRCGDYIDGKLPACAGHVPVEFVMIAEETELAIRAVSKLVGVGAWRQFITGAAKVSTDAIAQILSVVRL